MSSSMLPVYDSFYVIVICSGRSVVDVNFLRQWVRVALAAELLA
jgi:hypothetical protein